MALIQTAWLQSTNVTRFGTVEILQQTQVSDEQTGVVFGTANHRYSLPPSSPFNDFEAAAQAAGVPQSEIDRAKRVCVAAWDETTVAVYEGKIIEDYNAKLAQAQAAWEAEKANLIAQAGAAIAAAQARITELEAQLAPQES